MTFREACYRFAIAGFKVIPVIWFVCILALVVSWSGDDRDDRGPRDVPLPPSSGPAEKFEPKLEPEVLNHIKEAAQ